ncbi:MAG: PadR family transcriptional regulator [Chloroflexota bacterium]|nr:MAG: PadR family transcriptional regulator [Chloroflexota bacterium]
MSVRHALLGLLAQKPCHGYELHASFEALAGGDSNWDVKTSQIYATLDRLMEAGLVECASDLGEGDEPSRRIYALTYAGVKALQQWFDSGVAPEHQRDEFYIKLMVGMASGIGDPYKILHTQRSFIFQQLHAATTQRETLDSRVELAQILLLEKAIMHLEADLRWLDLTEARLDDIRHQPLPKPEIKPRGRPKKVRL